MILTYNFSYSIFYFNGHTLGYWVNLDAKNGRIGFRSYSNWVNKKEYLTLNYFVTKKISAVLGTCVNPEVKFTLKKHSGESKVYFFTHRGKV